ncbi:DUF4190 domain-containing protein [Rossellomorea aquimaris]|jgi:uncharacterized membrane protein|uniref:DUF4190 domain-containing protein n=1 Tax=Rossellomorea aquimaris TaxID=189382 RepID=A0A1J6WDA3_9BACI|nr:DUF4190 domain-containing protein [Rossellomorea aquimaris]OIU69856.1 hypothetical protein BHE18_02485 [Rossellomorea aquimaris]
MKIKTNEKAVISFILGIVSLFLIQIGLIVGIIGVVIARKSLNEIKSRSENGRSFAVAGLIINILGIVIQSSLTIAGLIGYMAVFY